jgi:hypothetical protein
MSVRCAIHPSRPAYDACPVCSRPRCRADAQQIGQQGCHACVATPVAMGAPGGVELAVRAGLAGLTVAYVGGWVGTQYVRVHLMSTAAPVVVGLAAAWAVPRAARRCGAPALVWGVAAFAALLGTALGFALTPGGQNPVHDWAVVGGPYLAALVGVAAGPLVLGGPRPRAKDGRRSAHPPGDAAGEGLGSDL